MSPDSLAFSACAPLLFTRATSGGTMVDGKSRSSPAEVAITQRRRGAVQGKRAAISLAQIIRISALCMAAAKPASSSAKETRSPQHMCRPARSPLSTAHG
jgi:hypothetical protein